MKKQILIFILLLTFYSTLYAQNDILVFRSEYVQIDDVVYDVNDPAEDGSSSIYSIVSGNTNSYYKINNKTGRIKINNLIPIVYGEVQMSSLKIQANSTIYNVSIADGFDYFMENFEDIESYNILTEKGETYIDVNSEWTAYNNLWGNGNAVPNKDFRQILLYKNSLDDDEKVIFLWDVPGPASEYDGASVWSYANIIWGNRDKIRDDLEGFPFKVEDLNDLWLDFNFEFLFGTEDIKIALNAFFTNEDYLVSFKNNMGDFFFVFDQRGTYIPNYPKTMPDIEIEGKPFAVRYDPDSRGDDPDGYERRRVIIKDNEKCLEGKLDLKSLFDMFSNEGYLNTEQSIPNIQLGLEVTDGFGALRFNKADMHRGVPLSNEKNILEFTVDVFPNPTTNEVSVSGINNIDDLLLYNYRGQEMKVKKEVLSDNKTQIDLSNLSDGVYFLKYKNITKKIIKRGEIN